MLRTYIYVPEELDKKVARIAKEKKSSKASVIRDALEKGVVAIELTANASIDVLYKIAEIGKKNNLKGPKGLSTNLDKYLWESHE